MTNQNWSEKKIEKKWPDPEGELAIDLCHTEKEIIIQSAVAGVKSEDINISVEKDVLIIKGSRNRPEQYKNCNYFIEECYWGNFSRKIIITEDIDPSRIDASMKDGILTIKIPKVIKDLKEPIKIKQPQ